jgi:hypothetical protein
MSPPNVPLHFEENWVPKFKMLLCITLKKKHPRLYNNTFEWQAWAYLGGDALM